MIKGRVQGVGFRPFIYRLASVYGLTGNVDNRNNGVYINVEGEEESVLNFRDQIISSAPAASRIRSVELKPASLRGYRDFAIQESLNESRDITEITPDLAVCSDCLEDMDNDPARIGYPFTNCTNCGPRFTIIRGLPYDRIMTSMSGFKMCSTCSREYNDITDRRFHAQPVACNNCGPTCSYESGSIAVTDFAAITDEIAARIAQGKSVAIKGLGGYHLVCDALNNAAVSELRLRKRRDSKPFAVMFRDPEVLKEFCLTDDITIEEITSWRRPVIILRQKRPLAGSVSNGLGTIGAILPYMPMHYLLFRKLSTPAIVLTSGNLSDEPLITDDNEAREKLLPVAGAIMTYNREIVNRADDSVMRIIAEKPSLIRRSRGFVPGQVALNCCVEGIVSVGAEQKNTFCLGRGEEAIMSQHIGDLKNPQSYGFFCESLKSFISLFRFTPKLIACDLHPSYLSTLFAEKFASEHNIPLVTIQHHHAHIASCMAEHQLTGSVIGISMDGTGYGTDGNSWGSEFMIADYDGYTPMAHFDYVPLPGGDKAIEEPWRMAYSYLYRYFGDDIDYLSIPAFKNVSGDHLLLLRKMITGNINVPLSSGAGRLFDAVAAITGLCTISGFEAEAPVRLESAIKAETDEQYCYDASGNILFAETLRGILADLGKKDVSLISAKFHNTIASVIAEVTSGISKRTGIKRVVLSGGLFQNKYLTERSIKLLEERALEVFVNRQVPSNDGGISLGQLIIASQSDKYVLKHTG